MSSANTRLRIATLAGLAFPAAVAPFAQAQPASLSLPPTTTSYVQVAGNTVFATPQFTAAAWIRPTGPGELGGATIISCGQRPGAANFGCSWWLGWTASNGRLSAMVVNQWGVTARVVNSTGSVPLNTWAHVAMTFDGTTVRVYINSQLDTQAAYGFASIDYPALPAINIGRFLDGPSYTFNHLDGQIDDVTVWNRALDTTELAALIQCEPAVDAAGLLLYLPFTSDSVADRSTLHTATTAIASPTFDVNPPALGLRPLITSGPEPARTCPGGHVSFTFAGPQPGPFTYRWRKGTTLIDTVANPSATTPTLMLSNVQPEDAANYDCIITGTCGSITSQPAALTVSCPNKADVAGLGGSGGCDGQNTADDIVFYLAAFFSSNTAVADIVGLGGSGGPDGAVTTDDLIAFLAAFFAGCP
ncbi:MAG: LamG-like jellyroll fold domain-containing protein [Phycisphaerales bacterium]